MPVHATVIMMGQTGLNSMCKEFQGGFILFGNLPGTLSYHLVSYPRDTNLFSRPFAS